MHHVKVLFVKNILSLLNERNIEYNELIENIGLDKVNSSSFIELVNRKQTNGFFKGRQLVDSFGNETGQLICTITIDGRKCIKESMYEEIEGIDELKILEEEMEILLDKDVFHYMLTTVSKIHKGDEISMLMVLLIGMTPWIDTDTIHYYAMGKSGKGKSTITTNALTLFPKSKVEVISSSSPKAFYYAFLNGKLNMNKIILFDDIMANNDEMLDVIKAFSSASKVKPRHWTLTSQREFMDIEPNKKYSIWLTSVDPIQDDQLKNRFLMSNVDESEEQDIKVRNHIDKIYRAGNEGKKILGKDFDICKNMTSILMQEDSGVIIPYKIEFPTFFDRRSYPYFLILIKASAFYNKFKRERIGDFIVASEADFEIANIIWNEIIRYQVSKVTEESLKLIPFIPLTEENAISRSDLVKLAKISTSSIRRRCAELMDMEIINATQSSNRQWAYWINVEVSKKRLNSKSVSLKRQTAEDLYAEIKEMKLEDVTKNAIKEELIKNNVVTDAEELNFLVEKEYKKKIENIFRISKNNGVSDTLKYVKKNKNKKEVATRQDKPSLKQKYEKILEHGEIKTAEAKEKFDIKDEEIEKLLRSGMLIEKVPGVLEGV